MADKKVLVTSSGVYAVEGKKTVALEKGEEVTLEASQAERLVKRGRVEYVTNTKPKAESK